MIAVSFRSLRSHVFYEVCRTDAREQGRSKYTWSRRASRVRPTRTRKRRASQTNATRASLIIQEKYVARQTHTHAHTRVQTSEKRTHTRACVGDTHTHTHACICQRDAHTHTRVHMSEKRTHVPGESGTPSLCHYYYVVYIIYYAHEAKAL